MPKRNKKKNKSGKCPNVEKKVEEISRMLEESTAKVQVSSVSIPKNQPGATTLTVETKLSKDELLKVKNVMDCVRISNKPVENTKSLTDKLLQNMNEITRSNKPIVADKPLDEIRQKPFSLPSGFKWDTLELSHVPCLIEVSQFLSENHVENGPSSYSLVIADGRVPKDQPGATVFGGCYRFDYSPGINISHEKRNFIK